MTRQQTILIVEDNDQNRLLLRDILTYHGYGVLEASTGVEGIEMARCRMPDLVLMDIQMPGMDGISVTRMLKADSLTSRVRIIALTSFAMAGDREKMLLAGFDDYIAKPIDTRELPQILKKHLDNGNQMNRLSGDDQGDCMKGTILVVDDSEQNRLLLQDVLTQAGFTVLVAKDGAEGVRMAREHQPALIMMDIQMPVMNGLEAGKLLRADPCTKGIKILALSAYNSLDDNDGFFASGFDGYIGKPFDIRTLSKTIMEYLSTP